MIEINLLPEDLVVKSRVQNPGGPGLKFEKKYIIFALPLLLVLFILIHFVLGAALIYKNTQLNSLNKKWTSLEAQRSALGSFQGARGILTQDATLIQQLSKQRVDWAGKLNKISLGLPSGVWLTELTVNQNDLTLKGSVISLQKEEMNLIDKFMDALKDDPVFFADFSSLEVGQVQKKQLGGYEVADFTIKGGLRQK